MNEPVADLWLSDAEQRAWRCYITGSVVVGRLLDRALKAHGLSHEDYGILSMLSEAPDRRLRPGELAAQLRVPKPFITYRVQRLEQEGLLERRDCPSDARSVFCVLTPFGLDTVRKVAPAHVGSVRRAVFDHLTDTQIEQLGAIMATVLSGIDAAECGERQCGPSEGGPIECGQRDGETDSP